MGFPLSFQLIAVIIVFCQLPTKFLYVLNHPAGSLVRIEIALQPDLLEHILHLICGRGHLSPEPYMVCCYVA